MVKIGLPTAARWREKYEADFIQYRNGTGYSGWPENRNPAAGKIWERAKPKMVGVCPGRGRIVRK